MSFELIEAEKANFPKALMCRALGLSRSGHHAFETRGPSKHDLEQQKLDVAAAAIFAEEEGRYGAPRVEKEMRRRGAKTSRKRVARSLARQGLKARQRRRWKNTTDSSHRELVAPNILARDFTAEAPDKVWVADTTYLPVLGGFIYLMVILDLFSRKVVGWSLGDSLDAELSGEALRKALARRSPPPGLLFHSDRGIEFAAKSFRLLLPAVDGRGVRRVPARPGLNGSARPRLNCSAQDQPTTVNNPPIPNKRTHSKECFDASWEKIDAAEHHDSRQQANDTSRHQLRELL